MTVSLKIFYIKKASPQLAMPKSQLYFSPQVHYPLGHSCATVRAEARLAVARYVQVPVAAAVLVVLDHAPDESARRAGEGIDRAHVRQPRIVHEVMRVVGHRVLVPPLVAPDCPARGAEPRRPSHRLSTTLWPQYRQYDGFESL